MHADWHGFQPLSVAPVVSPQNGVKPCVKRARLSPHYLTGWTFINRVDEVIGITFLVTDDFLEPLRPTWAR